MEEAELLFKNDSLIWYSPKNSECLLNFTTSKKVDSFNKNESEVTRRSYNAFGTSSPILYKDDKIQNLSFENAPEFSEIIEKSSNQETMNQTETCKR